MNHTQNLSLLKSEMSNTYDANDIFTNAIKMEYWSHKYGFEKWFKDGAIRSNMLLNKEELYNESRHVRLNVINGDFDHLKKEDFYMIGRWILLWYSW